MSLSKICMVVCEYVLKFSMYDGMLVRNVKAERYREGKVKVNITCHQIHMYGRNVINKKQEDVFVLTS
jgi:hypothetical protein